MGIILRHRYSNLAQQVAALFANSEQGAWYDPSEFSTMYQDSTGGTPVTAVEQPIGLLLDKRLGLALAADEKAVFNAQGGAGVSYSGYQVTFTAAAASGVNAAADSGLVDGKYYEVVFTITGYTGGATQINLGGFTYLVHSNSANGTYTERHMCVGNSYLYVEPIAAGTTCVVTINSLKEVTGNHATQATSAARPVLSARVNALVASTTMATQNVTTVAAPYTLSFKGTGTVTLTGTSTAGPLVGTGASNRVSLTFTPTAGTLTLTVSGSVTDAQLEVGSVATRYQQITDSTTYDTAGFPHGAKTDGVDDRITTAAGGGASTAFLLGVAFKAGGAGTARVIWSDRGTNTGLRLEIDASNNLLFSGGNGTAYTTVTGNAITAGVKYVAVAYYDGAKLAVQVNLAAETSAAFSTLSAGAAAISIGASNVPGSWFRDVIYGVVSRNVASTESERNALRAFLNEKAGAY